MERIVYIAGIFGDLANQVNIAELKIRQTHLVMYPIQHNHQIKNRPLQTCQPLILNLLENQRLCLKLDVSA